MTHPIIEAIASGGDSAQRVATNLQRNRCVDRDGAWALIEACGTDRFGVSALNDRLTASDRDTTPEARKGARDRSEWRATATEFFLTFPLDLQHSILSALTNLDGAGEAARIQQAADDLGTATLDALRSLALRPFEELRAA